MPMDLVFPEDHLGNWDILSSWCVRPVESESRLIEIPEPQAEPERMGWQVELHGQAGHGKETVYCFFDTTTGDWFRLSAGSVDPDRQLLLGLSDNDALEFIDLNNGARYPVQASRDRERAPIIKN